MQVEKQQLAWNMEQWTGSKWGNEYVKAVYCILSLCLFNLYTEYIRLNAWLDEAQTGKVSGEMPGEISITSDMQMTPPLWNKVKRN